MVKKKFLIQSGIQFLLLMGFWLILSGHYDVFHIGLGVFSVTLIMALNWRYRFYFYSRDNMFKESNPRYRLRMSRFLFFYIPWLCWQIVTAALQVAYVVISPRMPVDPSIITFKTRLKKTTSRVILGNSITLTPGTITIDLDQDRFTVHSLMDVSFSGIADDSLPHQVAQLYDRKPGQIISDLKVWKGEKRN